MNNSNRTYSGDIDLSSNFTLLRSRPIDDRMSLTTQSALFDTTTWSLNNLSTRYSGLITAVVADQTDTNNGVYWLPKSANYNKQSWDSSDNATYDVNGWRKLLDNTSVLQPTAYSLNISYNSTLTPIYNPFVSTASIVLGNNIRYNQAQIDSEFINNIQVMDGAALSADMTSSSYTIQNLDPSLIDSSAMYMLVTSTFDNRRAYAIPAWSSGSGNYSGITTLGGLTDVIFSSNGPQNGDVLTYNNGVWVNQSITIPTVNDELFVCSFECQTNIMRGPTSSTPLTATDIWHEIVAGKLIVCEATDGATYYLSNAYATPPYLPITFTSLSYANTICEIRYIMEDSNGTWTHGTTTNQVNSDWNATSGPAKILNKPELATVATSGDYNDLTNTPIITIPTVPTNVSAFNNDAGYLTSQVQSNWNESNQSSPAYIRNKPNIPASLSIFKCQYNSSNNSMGTTSTQDIIDACNADKIVICESNEILYYLSEHLELSNNDADEITFLGFKQGTPQNICWIQYKDGAGWNHGQFDLQPDWNVTNQYAYGFIKNKPTFATVATSGNYNDLTNLPTNISSFTNNAGYVTLSDVVFICYAVEDSNNPGQYQLYDDVGANANLLSVSSIYTALHDSKIVGICQLNNDIFYLTTCESSGNIYNLRFTSVNLDNTRIKQLIYDNMNSFWKIDSYNLSVTVTPNSSSQTLSYGGTFSAITSVSQDSYGRITGYNTATYTLPLAPAPDSYVFVCHYNTNTGQMDKTVSEIEAAYVANKTVICYVDTSYVLYLYFIRPGFKLGFIQKGYNQDLILDLIYDYTQQEWQFNQYSLASLLNVDIWSKHVANDLDTLYTITVGDQRQCVIIDNSSNTVDLTITFLASANSTILGGLVANTYHNINVANPVQAGDIVLVKAKAIDIGSIYYEITEMDNSLPSH